MLWCCNVNYHHVVGLQSYYLTFNGDVKSVDMILQSQTKGLLTSQNTKLIKLQINQIHNM